MPALIPVLDQFSDEQRNTVIEWYKSGKTHMERIEVYRDRWFVGIEADKLRAFAEQYLGIEVFVGLQ